jgi:hypothetical protein
MTETPPQKDPRNRPYRVLTVGLYLVVSVGFSLGITVNVVTSVLALSPTKAPTVGPPLGVGECRTAVAERFRELEARRQGLAAAGAKRSDLEWVKFRKAWLEHLRDLEERCAQGGAERRPLAGLFAQLEAVLDAYTTDAFQFSAQVAPQVDELRRGLEAPLDRAPDQQ